MRGIDPTRVAAIGRLGSPHHVADTGDAVFEQARIPCADLVDSTG